MSISKGKEPYNVIDEHGELTQEGKELVVDKMYKQLESEIVDDLKKLDKE